MKVRAAPRILAVAAFCAAVLIGFVVNEGIARSSGQEVLLSVEGVDPRDRLSGHYVQLAFNQRLEPGEACPPRQADWPWMALRQRGDTYVVAGGAPSRAEAELVGPSPIKATYSCTPPTLADTNGSPAAPGWVHLDLPIDRFYVNQADAQRIERVMAEQRNGEAHRVLAIVSVSRDGQVRLKGLVVDGQRLELNWL